MEKKLGDFGVRFNFGGHVWGSNLLWGTCPLFYDEFLRGAKGGMPPFFRYVPLFDAKMSAPITSVKNFFEGAISKESA